jgi:hypothetical protein
MSQKPEAGNVPSSLQSTHITFESVLDQMCVMTIFALQQYFINYSHSNWNSLSKYLAKAEIGRN